MFLCHSPNIYAISGLPSEPVGVLLDGNYKLHRVPGKDGAAKYTLFNLIKDIKEKQDLAQKEPAKLKQMRAGLAAWQKSVIKSLNGDDYSK